MYGPPPTQAGFLTFLRGQVGIPTGALPDDSGYIPLAYTIAKEIVLPALCVISPQMYTLAVYNLGASGVLNYAQDITGAPDYPGTKLPYFSGLRQSLALNSFVAGVVQSTGDEGTNESLLVPEFFKDLTLANLQQLKDPYGRAYLQIAQSTGTLWGST